PGDDCARGQVCAFNAYCAAASSGVCECPGGMATRDGRCAAATAPQGDACVTSANCHRFSFCDNGYCICKTGYALLNGYCVPLTQHMRPDSPFFMAINRPPFDAGSGADADTRVDGLPPNRNPPPPIVYSSLKALKAH